MPTALVVYASRHGATAGIAERIGKILEENEVDAIVARASDLPDPRDCDAYVIGSAVYMGQWEKAAVSFTDQHKAILATRPVWLFSSGPVGTERVDKKGNDLLDDPPIVSRVSASLHPRGTKVFFGAWYPNAPGATFAERLVTKMPAIKDLLPTGDFRDWPEIDAWAREIASVLSGRVTAEILV
jgi:menaquinone-dependent protoporphyrinogen oxidase